MRSLGFIRIPLRFTAAVAAAAILAACSLLLDDQLPSPQCNTEGFEPAPTLTCEAAVQAAVDSLDSSHSVTELTFQYGGLCPPGARCALSAGNAGTVIITFEDTGPVSVLVSIGANGQLVVDAPHPYPPPDWDL